MPIQLTCPNCSKTLRVPDHLVGEQVRCPGCSTEFVAAAQMPAPVEDDSPYRAADDAPPVPKKPPRSSLQDLDDDDDWDDEEYDRPMSRRRRGRASRRARERTQAPGIALLVTGILSLLMGFAMVSIGTILIAEPEDADDRVAGIQLAVSGPYCTALSVLIILGAIGMIRGRRHGLAITAAVLSMVPCTNPCWLLGLPFGIWAMIVLCDKDVKASFT